MEGSDAEVEDELVDGAPEAAAAAQGPPQKKAKLLPGERHLNGAQTKLTKLQAALDKKEEQIAATMSRGAKKPLNPREEETIPLRYAISLQRKYIASFKQRQHFRMPPGGGNR